MRRIVILAAMMLSLLSPSAWARTIVFATDPTWPPMEFVDAGQKISGFAIDYMNAAAAEAGFTAEFKTMAWDDIFAGLAAGKYDAVCSSVSVTEERMGAMDFSTPYFKVRQALLVPAASPAKSLADMKGRTVGAQMSTTGHFAIKKTPGITDKTYDELGPAIEDLAGGRIDGVVCDDPVAAQYAMREAAYAGKLKLAAVIDTGEDEFYAVAVKKGDKATLKLVNAGIEAVKAKGVDSELKKKWIGQ
jgi:polar amino acid transport system substrate-binding protein